MTALGLEVNPKSVKKIMPVWWNNPRTKPTGGLQLTELGFDSLTKADIKSHKIKTDSPIQYTSQLIIWMDNNIDCPFYITKKEIYVFGEHMAVQLILFSGDIVQLHSAAKRFAEKQKIS